MKSRKILRSSRPIWGGRRRHNIGELKFKVPKVPKVPKIEDSIHF